MAGASVGEMLRDWRARRSRSQLDLAMDVGVSTRHLSFVETGRSRPSPELVQAISEHLEVPLRERNVMLLAAGYAPRYSQRSLDDPTMAQVRDSLLRMIEAHDPYPGLVVDRCWNVVLSNTSAQALVAGLPEHVLQPQVNVFRVCLHPDGLAAVTLAFEPWARHLLHQIRRTLRATGDPDLSSLLDEVLGYPNLAEIVRTSHDAAWETDPPLLVPLRLRLESSELSLFTTVSTFGTPMDVTLDELSVELFFPADEATERLLRNSPNS